jgi:AcrR family transcriptional regulator
MLSGMARPKTRDEILRVATERFTRDGFKGASLHDIAAEVGVSKGTLLYHFSSKEAILTALIAPALADLTAMVAHLRGLDDDAVQPAAIDGFVDLVLRYRHEVALMYDLMPQFLQNDFFAPVRPLTEYLCAAVAGRSPDPAADLAARVVLGGIAAVVIDDPREPDELQPILTGIARRALIPPPDKD